MTKAEAHNILKAHQEWRMGAETEMTDMKKLTQAMDVAIKALKPKNQDYDSQGYFEAVEFWLKEFHVGWTFTKLHGLKLKSILQKIGHVNKSKTSNVELFKTMCLMLPDWYKDKDLAILDSKFNEIITQIKNGKQAANKSVQQGSFYDSIRK